MSARIDAHVHHWRVDRGDYSWLAPGSKLHRDFLPPDAAPHLDAAGIDGIVLVQAAPTEAETRFLLGLAQEDARVRGVVGWIDMEARDAPDRLATLAADPMLRAVRPMWQDIPDDGWMLRPALDPAYRAIVDLDLGFDALARVRHLPNLLRLIGRHPDLRVVVDHGAKPDIAGGGLADWRRGMTEIAAVPHLRCKLSGLVTEAAPDAPVEAVRPYAEALLELFGPSRLIFGSDWPVCTLRCTYMDWWRWTQGFASGLTQAERDAVFGGNAAAFYGLA